MTKELMRRKDGQLWSASHRHLGLTDTACAMNRLPMVGGSNALRNIVSKWRALECPPDRRFAAYDLVRPPVSRLPSWLPDPFGLRTTTA